MICFCYVPAVMNSRFSLVRLPAAICTFLSPLIVEDWFSSSAVLPVPLPLLHRPVHKRKQELRFCSLFFDRQVNISSPKMTPLLVRLLALTIVPLPPIITPCIWVMSFTVFARCCCRNSSCIFKVIRGSYSNAAFKQRVFLPAMHRRQTRQYRCHWQE